MIRRRASWLVILLVLLMLGTALASEVQQTQEGDETRYTLSISFAYSKESYVIDAAASTGGIIAPSGRRTVEAGTDITFSFIAQPGYRFVRLVVDGGIVSESPNARGYRFIRVAADHTILAEFERIETPTAGATPRPGATARPSTGGRTSGGRGITATPVPSASADTAQGGETEDPAPTRAPLMQEDAPMMESLPKNLGYTFE